MENTAEHQMVTERMKKKLNDVINTAQSHLSPVQYHLNFTLQQAYCKCAYECFDHPSRKLDDISDCVDRCIVPVLTAQNHYKDETAKFLERLERSLMVCRDKYEAAKFQQSGLALSLMESCVDQTIQENIKTMPHLFGKLKKSVGVTDEAR